jgi:hypothetical protein
MKPQRYETDLTDDLFALPEPFRPRPKRTSGPSVCAVEERRRRLAQVEAYASARIGREGRALKSART